LRRDVLIGCGDDEVAVLGDHDTLFALEGVALDSLKERAGDTGGLFDADGFKGLVIVGRTELDPMFTLLTASVTNIGVGRRALLLVHGLPGI
jgi:hypothetical protein